jgi:hypothetical protein
MRSIKKLSATITLVALSLAIGVASVRASPETPQLGTTTLTSLLSSVLNTVNTVGDDTFSTADLSTVSSPPPTQHYGPYASTSPDSGTCNPDWATDTFDRHFSIFNQGGSLVVVEQFKDGSFVTGPLPEQPSPGACETPTPSGGMIRSGVNGVMHGYFIIPIPSTIIQTSDDPNCNAMTHTNTGCDTTTFMNTHFTPCYPDVCQVTTFFFHYAAGDQGLIEHEWTNASPDRGGNRGDIRST